MNVNYLTPENEKRRLRGPEKAELQKWWTTGTTQECLLSDGADLVMGFLQPTKQFTNMSQLSHNCAGK
eukprot:10808033-Prorocentrum_lima.AAC.1